MDRHTKTVEEKLNTRISKIKKDDKIKITKTQIKVGNKVLFKYSPSEVSYSKFRYFPSLKEEIKEEDFTASILLDHETLNLISGEKIWNPSRGINKVLEMFRHVNPSIDKIVIGGIENKINKNIVYVTYSLYSDLISINREEGKDKITRVRNRVAPFLKNNYSLDSGIEVTDRDYSLLLKEIIESKNITQKDIVAISTGLDVGENNEIVIEKQINKQAEWLLTSIQTIIDEPELSVNKAKKLGNELFGFPKNKISGPEDLMEKILTKYGQHIIFGVPALLNIDKYVISSTGLPKSQFDIILINYLSDIEIVELKRPDEYLLDYDSSRGKFYMSKALSVATAQSERYISAIYKEHDTDFKIDGKTIREYIESQVSDTITLSVCRPRALIVIGVIQRLAKPYEDLSSKDKLKISKKDYNKNLETAYKELKSSFKNIDITTYTELVEGARLRLQ